MKKGYIPKDQRKKILMLSDDIRTRSGVGNMAREIVVNTAHHFNWINLGGAVNHPEAGKGFDQQIQALKDQIKAIKNWLKDRLGYKKNFFTKDLLQENSDFLINKKKTIFFSKDGLFNFKLLNTNQYIILNVLFCLIPLSYIIGNFAVNLNVLLLIIFSLFLFKTKIFQIKLLLLLKSTGYG